MSEVSLFDSTLAGTQSLEPRLAVRLRVAGMHDERERYIYDRLRALRHTRPHTVGYIGGCDQEEGMLERPCARHGRSQLVQHLRRHLPIRKVDVRLPGKGNSNSHGARPVHLIITMIKWIRTSRLSIKNSLPDTTCPPSMV